MKVLIIEDDRTNQELLGLQAEDVQFAVDVITASNGVEGLERALSSGTLGVILLDLGLPQMDGFEFLTRLRNSPGHRTTPVIVVTARDVSPADHRVLANMGVGRILQKGRYDTRALADAITELAQ